MFGDVTVSSRPLRFAFLIRPTAEDFQKAVHLNSTLWGGTFNPIIPLYRRAPKTWRHYPGEKVPVQKRVLGYLREFDPDVVVDVGGAGLPDYLSKIDRVVIKADAIWSDFPQNNTPEYGIGVPELLGAIYHEYFERVRRFPYKVTLANFPDIHRVFWSSLIGELPPNFKNFVTKYFSEALDIEEPTLDPHDFYALARPDALTPRRITKFDIDQEQRGRIREDTYALFFDAGHLGDLIDFWNLRALGRAVFPLPKQFAFENKNLDAARTFIKENFRVSLHNPSLMFGTHIIRGQSATMPELEAYAKALDIQNYMPDGTGSRAVGLQHWFPRIWDEWAVTKDSATPDRISSKTEEFSFRDTKGAIAFKVVEPKFGVSRYRSQPKYANDITLKFYGENDKTLANVLPYDHGKEVIRAASGLLPFGDDFRIGRSGLVHLCSWRSQIHLDVPLAEDVFFAWLKDKGYSPELSTCGLLAKQVNAHLKGWINVLSNEGLLSLFDRMNGGVEEGRGAGIGEVKNALKNISPRGDLYRMLSERGVFQLGFKTQCPLCRRGSWYSIRDLGSELTCPLCHERISALAAVDTDNKGSWHLKTAGPFSVGNHADGSYSVLLTHSLFQHDHSLQTTPVLSFTARSKAGNCIEADFGMLWRDTLFGETEDGALFAECKSYNTFEKKDFDRMRELAREFPGAVLAFCTLRKELTPREIKGITRLAKAGRKHWKPERPLNPVLVLTGNELFGFGRPPSCWKEKAVPDWTKNVHSLLQICNATQSIYLGLPHWGEQWTKDFEKRRANKVIKKRRAPKQAA